MITQHIKHFIIKVTDFIYSPFKPFISLKTFRYVFCGGGNAVLNIALFSLSYHFIFKHDTIFWDLSITRYAKAYTLALVFTFPIGFFLLKNIVFKECNTKNKTQLWRYALVNVSCIIFDYMLLYILIGHYNLPPTLSQTLILITLSLYSYVCQTYFTFSKK